MTDIRITDIRICPVCRGNEIERDERPVCDGCAFDMAQEEISRQEPTALELFLDRNPCLTVLDYEDFLNGYGLNDKETTTMNNCQTVNDPDEKLTEMSLDQLEAHITHAVYPLPYLDERDRRVASGLVVACADCGEMRDAGDDGTCTSCMERYYDDLEADLRSLEDSAPEETVWAPEGQDWEERDNMSPEDELAYAMYCGEATRDLRDYE